MQPSPSPVSPTPHEGRFGSLRGIVFDHDGTLIDTESAEYHAVRRIWERHGVELTMQRWSHVVGGVDDGDWWYRELGELVGTPIDPAAALDERRRYSREHLADTGLRDGIRRLVDAAADAGLPIAVATNAPSWWVERHMGRLGVVDSFVTIVGVDVASAPKPDPAPFAEACARIGAAPHEVVAFEDSAVGVASAVAAGCFTIACPCPLTLDHDLSAAHARIDSHADVTLPWLADRHAAWLTTRR